MLREIAKKYYLENDLNCAESIVISASEMYNLGLTLEDAKLVAAFGGGMGCGKTCGALAGCLAILGKLNVTGQAHATEGFKEFCAKFVDDFKLKLSSIECEELGLKYKTEENRCLKTVELAADLLESYIK